MDEKATIVTPSHWCKPCVVLFSRFVENHFPRFHIHCMHNTVVILDLQGPTVKQLGAIRGFQGWGYYSKLVELNCWDSSQNFALPGFVEVMSNVKDTRDDMCLGTIHMIHQGRPVFVNSYTIRLPFHKLHTSPFFCDGAQLPHHFVV